MTTGHIYDYSELCKFGKVKDTRNYFGQKNVMLYTNIPLKMCYWSTYVLVLRFRVLKDNKVELLEIGDMTEKDAEEQREVLDRTYPFYANRYELKELIDRLNNRYGAQYRKQQAAKLAEEKRQKKDKIQNIDVLDQLNTCAEKYGYKAKKNDYGSELSYRISKEKYNSNKEWPISVNIHRCHIKKYDYSYWKVQIGTSLTYEDQESAFDTIEEALKWVEPYFIIDKVRPGYQSHAQLSSYKKAVKEWEKKHK